MGFGPRPKFFTLNNTNDAERYYLGSDLRRFLGDSFSVILKKSWRAVPTFEQRQHIKDIGITDVLTVSHLYKASEMDLFLKNKIEKNSRIKFSSNLEENERKNNIHYNTNLKTELLSPSNDTSSNL